MPRAHLLLKWKLLFINWVIHIKHLSCARHSCYVTKLNKRVLTLCVRRGQTEQVLINIMPSGNYHKKDRSKEMAFELGL